MCDSVLSAAMSSPGREGDAALVTRYLAGDQTALGTIYERYADRVFDLCQAMLHSDDDAADAFQDTFVIAARKLEGLRDRERLRPWLYSVARNQCRARLRSRKRTRPTDEARIEAAQDGIEIDMTRDLSRVELAGLMDEARAGLNDRDQDVLDLHMRHGLEGDELAAVLGVSTQNAYKLVQRVRDRVGRSLGSLLVARHGRRDCDGLAVLLADWDGAFSPLVRKRVSRHVDDCDTCSTRRKALFDPRGLASAMPLEGPPSELHGRVGKLLAGGAVGAVVVFEPAWAPSGFPSAARAWAKKIGLFATAVALIVVATAIGTAVLGGEQTVETAGDSTFADPTGESIPDGDESPVPTTTPEPAVTETATTAPASSSTATTSEPATTTTTEEATAATTSTTSATTTTTTVPPAPDAEPPELIRGPSAVPSTIWESARQACTDGARSPRPTTALISLRASDNIGVTMVSVSWVDAGGGSVHLAQDPADPAQWSGVFPGFSSGTFGERTDVTLTSVAIDAAGNESSAASAIVTVVPCP